MGKTYDKIMAAKQKAATQEGWAGAAGAVAGAVRQKYEHDATANANEQALAALHPELAGKGLGDALAQNPSLSKSLLEPTIEAQSRSSLQASEYKLSGANAEAHDTRQAGFDRENDARTTAREKELETMREADRARGDELQYGTGNIQARAAAEHGLSPEAFAQQAEADRVRKSAESEANIAQSKAATAESGLKAKSAEREMAPVTAEYDPELPPRIYRGLKEGGATRADVEKAKERYRLSEHDKVLADNYANQDENSKARQAQAKADLEFKQTKDKLGRDIELKKINATNFRSALNNPLALQALRSDPEMKDHFSKSLGKGFDDWLSTKASGGDVDPRGEGGERGNDGDEPPKSTATERKDSYTEQYRPKITDPRYRKAFDEQSKRIDQIRGKLDGAKKAGLGPDEIAQLEAELDKKVESLKHIAASGAKD